MKKLLLIPLLFTMLAGYSQDTIRLAVKNADDYKKVGAVEQWAGVSIFVSCTPVAKYEVLGKVQIAMYTDFKDVQERLAEKAKHQFASAEAIILDLSRSLPTAIVIRFTNSD